MLVTVAITAWGLNSTTAPRSDPSAPPKNDGALPTVPAIESGIGNAGINAAMTYKVIASTRPTIIARKNFITAFGLRLKAWGKRRILLGNLFISVHKSLSPALGNFSMPTSGGNSTFNLFSSSSWCERIIIFWKALEIAVSPAFSNFSRSESKECVCSIIAANCWASNFCFSSLSIFLVVSIICIKRLAIWRWWLSLSSAFVAWIIRWKFCASFSWLSFASLITSPPFFREEGLGRREEIFFFFNIKEINLAVN